MKSTRTRKLLRISTFLAVSAGLAIGSTAMAASPLELAQDEPIETTPGEEDTEGLEVDIDIDTDEEVAEDVDYPGDIEDFSEFIEEHRTQGIENVPEYTYEGTKLLYDAMEEVIPGETRLFRDRTPEHAQEFEDQLEAWEDRIDELSDEERDDFARVTSDILNDAAQWLTRVQESDYPGLTNQVEAVQNAVDEIDSESNISLQGDAVQSFFEASLAAVQDMYVAKEEDPLAQSPTVELIPASHPIEVAQDTMEDPMDDTMEEPAQEPMEDPMDDTMEESMDEPTDELAVEVELSPEIQTYVDGVEELDAELISGEEGEQLVVTNLQNLEGALATFVDDDQAVEESEEMIEGAGYDESAEEHGELDNELSEHHERFNTQLGELEESIGTDEYSDLMEETIENASELLTAIQGEQYPQFEEQAEQIRNAADAIDGGTELAEQSDAILEFFTLNAGALEAMDQEREAPITLLW